MEVKQLVVREAKEVMDRRICTEQPFQHHSWQRTSIVLGDWGRLQSVLRVSGSMMTETRFTMSTWLDVKLFLPRDAMHKRGLCCHAVSVCVRAVCLSHSWIVSKLINISSKFFPHHSSFFLAKQHGKTLMGTTPPPLTGTSNASGVGRNRYTEPISGFLCLLLALQRARCCQQGHWGTTATVLQVMTHHW